MDLSVTHTYQGSVSEVLQLLTTQEFIEDVARHCGAESATVTVGDHTANLNWTLAVPDNVPVLQGKSLEVTQQMTWNEPAPDGSVTGIVTVKAPSVKLDVHTDAKLTPSGEQTSRGDYVGTLKVGIPLVGKKIEQMVEPYIMRAFRAIEQRANAWLNQ